MNSRERLLAILLIVLMAGAAGGAGFYQFVWSPIKKDNEKIGKLETEIAELEKTKLDVEDKSSKFEKNTRKRSLPLDVNLAKKEYGRLLNNLLRKAEFDVTERKVTAREKNTTNVPMVVGKTPAYTKLEFDVVVKGDLISLVDFLYEFYRQPLLHQITKLTVVKPAGGRGRGGDLDITMLIQAIVLDKAENRDGLLPSAPAPVVTAIAGAGGSMTFNNHNLDVDLDDRLGIEIPAAEVLARPKKQDPKQTASASPKATRNDRRIEGLQEYRRIAGKNIFYGPAIAVKKDVDPNGGREMDLAPFVALIQVYHAPDGSGLAVIYDRSNKHYYEIHQSPKGAIYVEKFYFSYREEKNDKIPIKKKSDEYDTRALTFGSQETGNERSFRVKRILESDILIAPYSPELGRLMMLGGTASLALPGQLYSWHIGQVLRSEDDDGVITAPEKLGTRDGRHALLRPLNYEGSEVAPPPKKDAPIKKPGL